MELPTYVPVQSYSCSLSRWKGHLLTLKYINNKTNSLLCLILIFLSRYKVKFHVYCLALLKKSIEIFSKCMVTLRCISL